MGGDDSQKLLPLEGNTISPPGRKPPAHCNINTVAQRGLLRRRPCYADLQSMVTGSHGRYQWLVDQRDRHRAVSDRALP